jgi:hypothetical protein
MYWYKCLHTLLVYDGYHFLQRYSGLLHPFTPPHHFIPCLISLVLSEGWRLCTNTNACAPPPTPPPPPPVWWVSPPPMRYSDLLPPLLRHPTTPLYPSLISPVLAAGWRVVLTESHVSAQCFAFLVPRVCPAVAAKVPGGRCIVPLLQTETDAEIVITPWCHYSSMYVHAVSARAVYFSLMTCVKVHVLESLSKQFSTIEYNIMQYNTIQYNTIQICVGGSCWGMTYGLLKI